MKTVGGELTWRCSRCGRILAAITPAPGDLSLLEIVCPRCKERNVLDFAWLANSAETCTPRPGRS